MKTFLFIQKNGSAIITISAPTAEEARNELAEIVIDEDAFRLENEEGEEEDQK